jgi:magnesium transporter
VTSFDPNNNLIVELSLSQILNAPVLDRAGEPVGKLSDCIIVPGEAFPRITALEVKSNDKVLAIPMEAVDHFSKWIITLKDSKERITQHQPSPHDLYLVKDFLDKQVIDIHGAKVVRINDLKLMRFNGEYHLTGADIGLRGLCRRLKLEDFLQKLLGLFKKKLPEKVIAWNFVELLSPEKPRVKLTVEQSKINQLHPADIAEILTELSPQERTAVMEHLDDEKAADALGDVEPEISLEILDDLSAEKAASILQEMKPDEAADILGELPEEKVTEILSEIGGEEAADLKNLLAHKEDTAGGLMTPKFISLSGNLTVEEAINKLREMSPDAETIYYLYVVDEEEHLKGVVSLRDLIVSKPTTPLNAIMTSKVVKVLSSATKEEVAEIIAKYDLLAVPVVDESGKLLGIVTVDDVMAELVPPRWKRRMRNT